MGYDTRRYWNNKEKRAEKAREHTQLMDYYYGDEIKDIVEFDTKEYSDGFEINHKTYTREHTEFILEDIGIIKKKEQKKQESIRNLWSIIMVTK